MKMTMPMTSTTDVRFSLDDVASAASPGYSIVVREPGNDGSLAVCGDITDVLP
jgi:hypothetical protein